MNVTRGTVVKAIAIVLGVYVGIVVLFESLLGYFQPEAGNTIVITTTTDEGESHDRVVSLLESGEQMYVAANHWPRAWYRQALANPEVQVTVDGERGDYRVVPVIDAEYERLSEEFDTGLTFRFLTGFPPRRFVRLDSGEES
ncbi:MAG: nitroreductase/quinone reductase family protein [Pseudohongiellaceae bacterium]